MVQLLEIGLILWLLISAPVAFILIVFSWAEHENTKFYKTRYEKAKPQPKPEPKPIDEQAIENKCHLALMKELEVVSFK